MSEQLSLEAKKWEGGQFNVGVESTLRTDSSKYNQSTQNAQQLHEKLNTCVNWQVIIDAIKSGRARDINDEPKAFTNDLGEKMPCFIIGSGPSLDEVIPYLKEWKGGIICTTSHALTLMRFGIEPTHIMALDAFSLWDEIKGVDWSKTKTKLICHPGIWPDLISNWPNEMLLYIENNGRTDSFYSNTQKVMYSHREGDSIRTPTFHFYIRTEITLFACSPPIQLFAADLLGYGTIFCAGVDFGFNNEKYRFTSYDFDWDKWPYDKLMNEAVRIKNEIENGSEKDYSSFWDKFNQTMQDKELKKLEWQEHKHPFEMNERVVKCNNGLLSEEIHVYYKKNHLSAWRLCGKTMYITGPGIMDEVPFADIQEVIGKQGYGFPQQTPDFIADRVEPYLALVGAFVIDTPKGCSFVESPNPMIDLPQFMHEINKRYECPNCHIKVMVNDESNILGNDCPQCKTGKLIYEIGVDIKKNMERIERRIVQSKMIKIKE